MIHPLSVSPSPRLVLGSASPRRAELLKSAGFDFDVRAVEVDERLRPGEPPEQYVRRLAEAKSAAVHELVAGASRSSVITLAADTAVIVDGDILGKPASDEEAVAMLERLSGRDHEVLTGVSLRRGEREVGGVARTVVSMAVLSTQEIVWHVKSGEGRDKAGAYAIQGLASRFAHGICGSYSNVVGLPIALVYELIRKLSPAADDPCI
jgi:septum formation protein